MKFWRPVCVPFAAHSYSLAKLSRFVPQSRSPRNLGVVWVSWLDAHLDPHIDVLGVFVHPLVISANPLNVFPNFWRGIGWENCDWEWYKTHLGNSVQIPSQTKAVILLPSLTKGKFGELFSSLGKCLQTVLCYPALYSAISMDRISFMVSNMYLSLSPNKLLPNCSEHWLSLRPAPPETIQ